MPNGKSTLRKTTERLTLCSERRRVSWPPLDEFGSRESGTPIDFTSPPTESADRDVGTSSNQFADKAAPNQLMRVLDFHPPQ